MDIRDLFYNTFVEDNNSFSKWIILKDIVIYP